MDENGSGPKRRPYWGELLKADLLAELGEVSQKVDALSAQIRAKPSKNWVRVTVGAAFGSAVVVCFGLLKEHRAETTAVLAEHIKEEKQENMQVRTEIQSAANRLDSKMDKVLLRMVPRRRQVDEGGGQ